MKPNLEVIHNASIRTYETVEKEIAALEKEAADAATTHERLKEIIAELRERDAELKIVSNKNMLAKFARDTMHVAYKKEDSK